MKRVSVLGAGAWGTAIASLLADNGFQVTLWCYNDEVAESITKIHRNDKYLPGFVLSENIKSTTNLKEAVCDTEFIFEAIPVQFLRSVLEQTTDCFSKEQTWVILSKGIEQETLLLPSQMIDDVFGYTTKKAVLVGPSFAQDVMEKQVTGVTLAATDCKVGRVLQKMLANAYFRPYISLDIIGAQIGAALKNGITLGIGLLKGADYSDNAQAFLLTRGLHEMAQVAVAVGGRQKTIYGLSGVGDLVLTAMGEKSKNLSVGKELGAGKKLKTILQKTGYIPEGLNTVKSINRLMELHKLDLPICSGIYSVIFENKNVHELLKDLMNRPLEAECELQ